jgi:hypothetical protein
MYRLLAANNHVWTPLAHAAALLNAMAFFLPCLSPIFGPIMEATSPNRLVSNWTLPIVIRGVAPLKMPVVSPMMYM